MNEPSSEAPHTALTTFEINALRLLQLQQRLDAWDRLYNEEIVALRKELSLLAADYVRECQAQRHVAKLKRQPRPRRTV